MAKPSRADFNVKATRTDHVAWNCRKCGTSDLADNRGAAGKAFDKHNCTA